MKANTKEATVTSNIPSTVRSKKMGINAKSMRHVLGMLSNVYKDRELAVIREYYTNGLDAHAAAKVDRPVLVTLPTWDEPVYKVQDFGVGMTEDTLFDVYADYGTSSKQDTNEERGHFGLGAKSAFSIATQFTVISIKDGLQTTALFSKAQDGSFDANIMSSVPTSEENGTTVKIPVHSNMETFVDKAHKFFQFSPRGTVLVDGVEPDYFLENTERLHNPKKPEMEIYVQSKTEGTSYVIMGSVPYALTQENIASSLKRLNVTASAGFLRMPKYMVAPIGDVELTPDREGLMSTDVTNNLIDSHMDFLVNDLRELAQKELDTTETLEDFFKVYKRWNDIISIPCKWNGEEVPKDIRTKKYMRQIERSGWGSSSHTETMYLSLDSWRKFIVVSGYSADDYKKVNSYISPYMTAKGMNDADFIITDEEEFLDNKWLKRSSRFTFVKAEDLIAIGKEQRKKERAPRAAGTKEKIKYPVIFLEDEELRWVDYDVIPDGVHFLDASDLRKNSDALEYIRGQYGYPYDHHISESYRNVFTCVTGAKEIVLLSKTRTLGAFQKRVPNAINILDDIKNTAQGAPNLLSPDVMKYFALNESGWRKVLKSTGIDKQISSVKDPYIYNIVIPDDNVKKKFDQYEDIFRAIKWFDAENVPQVSNIRYASTPQDVNSYITTLDKKYPLVAALNMYSLKPSSVDHIIKYLNMVHRETLIDAVTNS